MSDLRAVNEVEVRGDVNGRWFRPVMPDGSPILRTDGPGRVCFANALYYARLYDGARVDQVAGAGQKGGLDG